MSEAAGSFSLTRWTAIVIFFLVTVLSQFFYVGIVQIIMPILSVISLFMAVILHGKERYGLKNIIIFFIITWVISHFFEAFSIQTGFPFGHYYYDKLAGPRLFEVPLIIMPAYFGMGYTSWILANILLGQYYQRLTNARIFIVPLIATFIMVMWDFCMDPVASQIASLWTWVNGGAYYGVPIQNYFGWFMVVYIIFQLFALYITRYDISDLTKAVCLSSRIFWIEAIALYAIQALGQLLDPLTQTRFYELYLSMALATVFTMVFVIVLAIIKIIESPPKLLIKSS